MCSRHHTTQGKQVDKRIKDNKDYYEHEHEQGDWTPCRKLIAAKKQPRLQKIPPGSKTSGSLKRIPLHGPGGLQYA